MALNFSRPDPSSPAAVGAAQFSVSRRGYDQEEVRDFLRMVSAELARLQERERFLESEMRAMQTRGLSDPGVLDEATVTQLLGAEAARVLAAAREASESMRQRAAESAEQLIREASHEASRVIDEAQVEAARRRSDLAGEVEAEIELAKQQGREMVAEVRAYREKVLADLARRTEEARRELERLVVERERVLGAFERARLAASDVVGELVEGDATLHEVGVAPPLIGADAPPPPVQSRATTVPFFDREKFPDGGDDAMSHSEMPYSSSRSFADEPVASAPAHEDDPSRTVATQSGTPAAADDVMAGSGTVAHETVAGDEPSAQPVGISGSVVDVPGESTTTESEATDSATTPTNSSETPTHTTVTPISPTQSLTTSAAPPSTSGSTDAPREHVAEVVQLFARRDAGTADRGTPLHPVFERVEPTAAKTRDDAERRDDATTPSSAAPKGVDELFARLRASSPDKVAATAKRSAPRSPSAKSSAPEQESKNRGPKSDKKKGDHRQTDVDNPAVVAEALVTPAGVGPVSVDTSVFAAREAALTPLTDAMTRKLKRSLADEENAVLTHLEGKRAATAIDAMLPGADVHLQQWVESVTEELVSAALAGAKAFNKGLRADLRKKVGDAAVMSVLASRINDELVRPLRERLQHASEQCAGDRADMSSRARSVYREWKMQRIDVVTADLARLAYARGIVLTTAHNVKLCWAVDPSGPPCADAEDNSLAGAVPCGEQFPTGHEHPIVHSGCRCLVVPVQQ